MARHPLREADYLDHMLEAIKLARNYAEGLDRENFLADKKTQQDAGERSEPHQSRMWLRVRGEVLRTFFERNKNELPAWRETAKPENTEIARLNASHAHQHPRSNSRADQSCEPRAQARRPALQEGSRGGWQAQDTPRRNRTHRGCGIGR